MFGRKKRQKEGAPTNQPPPSQEVPGHDEDIGRGLSMLDEVGINRSVILQVASLGGIKLISGDVLITVDGAYSRLTGKETRRNETWSVQLAVVERDRDDERESRVMQILTEAVSARASLDIRFLLPNEWAEEISMLD